MLLGIQIDIAAFQWIFLWNLSAVTCELFQIDWEAFVRILFKDVGVVREEFWNPLLVKDPMYFLQLATILAKTKTESIRKL